MANQEEKDCKRIVNRANFYYKYALSDKEFEKLPFQYVYIADIIGSTFALVAKMQYIEKSNKIKAIFKSINLGGAAKYALAVIDESPTVDPKSSIRHNLGINLVPFSNRDEIDCPIYLIMDKSFKLKTHYLNITILDKDVVGLNGDRIHNYNLPKQSDNERSCNITSSNKKN